MKKVLFLSENVPDKIVSRLENSAYSVRKMRASCRLLPPLSSHPDMLSFACVDGLLICGYYLDANEDLFDGVKTVRTDELHTKAYPGDILLNALLTDRLLFGRLDGISSKIIGYCNENGIKTVNIRQGYAKCSCLCIHGGIITADAGIAAAAAGEGIDVLLIRPEGIVLPGMSCGFIGGASFADDGCAYFFGDVMSLPDWYKIVEFCEKHNTGVISLSNDRLTDYGGGIIIS